MVTAKSHDGVRTWGRPCRGPEIRRWSGGYHCPVMPKNLTPAAIRDILERGVLDDLIGVLEDDGFETKRAPYQLDQEHQKQELAKDVTALANRDGGVLLIGPATEREPSHIGDEVRSVSTFAAALLNPETYHSVLGEWIYPRLEAVEIRWFPLRDDAARGIVAIFIAPQPEAQKPFLVTKTINESGRRTDILFGYAERRRGNAVPMTVQEIHALIRDGRSSDRNGRAIDELRHELREALRDRHVEQHRPPAIARGEVIARLNSAREAVGFLERACILYASYPAEETQVSGLFDATGPAVDVLEHPPELRRNGFVLADAGPGSSVIVRGELRRRLYQGHVLLELWRDGVLIGVAPADEDFLLWASRGRNTINPLVLAESGFVFVETAKRALQVMEPRPTEMWFEIHLSFLPGASMPTLAPGPLASMRWQVGAGAAAAPASAFDAAVRHSSETETGVIALDLVSRIYNWFGLPTNTVPYGETVNDRATLVPAQLVEAGR